MIQCRIYVAVGWRFISRSVVNSKPPIIFSHVYCVLMVQLSLKEPSWWIDVFWVFQGLFSVCLFYFLVCTCVVHKRCHHLIVTACTCQNNTNKNDLKVKSCCLCHHALSGSLGLSYKRIYFMLSLFMGLKVGKRDRDLLNIIQLFFCRCH